MIAPPVSCITKFDLKDGYLQIGRDQEVGANIWQTFIECMLIKNGVEKSFLATNCRAENVTQEGSIFSGKLAEVSVVKGWDQNFIFRAGPGIYHPFRGRLTRKLHCGVYDGGVNVVGKCRSVKYWSVREVLEALLNFRNDNFFYWSIRYHWDNSEYELIAPCKYINFSSIIDDFAYIQPISGYVIFEEESVLFISYISANISIFGQINAHVIKRSPIYIFDTKVGFAGPFTKLLGLAFLPFKWCFMTDEFNSQVKLDPEVKIFTYE